MRASALVAGLVLSSCATQSSSSAPPLETEFGGTWTGAASFALAGKFAVYYSVPVVIAVSGNTVSDENICPMDTRYLTTKSDRLLPPSLKATGSGAAAAWGGSLECPTVELIGCDAVAVTYTNATLTLSGINRLTVVALGKARGCNTSYPVILTFVGAK